MSEQKSSAHRKSRSLDYKSNVLSPWKAEPLSKAKVGEVLNLPDSALEQLERKLANQIQTQGFLRSDITDQVLNGTIQHVKENDLDHFVTRSWHANGPKLNSTSQQNTLQILEAYRSLVQTVMKTHVSLETETMVRPPKRPKASDWFLENSTLRTQTDLLSPHIPAPDPPSTTPTKAISESPRKQRAFASSLLKTNEILPMPSYPTDSMSTQRTRRPWSHFKIEIFDGRDTAYMTLSDIVPIKYASEDNVVHLVELDRLKSTMRSQLFQDHTGKELSFHGARVYMLRDDVLLRYVIKEAYYANDEALKLFLGSA